VPGGGIRPNPSRKIGVPRAAMLRSQSQLISQRTDQERSMSEVFAMSAASVGAGPTLKQSQEVLTDQVLVLPIVRKALETASITQKYRDAYPSARFFMWT